ncbi:MAG: C40 family peptidase [Lachnospiraceae bacterium]|nr:C40 family peptidase [Lachnospiraceae bacterium]
MKSDSLMKVTACVLTLSLTLCTCCIPVNASASTVVMKTEVVNTDIIGSGRTVVCEESNKEEEVVRTDNVDSAKYATAVTDKEDNNGEDISNTETKTEEGQTAEGVTEETQAEVTETGVEQQEQTEVTEDVIEQVSEYANTGISVADPYVNVRTEPNTDSEVRGKLYQGSAAEIVEQAGEWVKIKSGSVEGYIKTEFLAIGFSAEELIGKYGKKHATVMTETLNVREAQDNTSRILAQVGTDEVYNVLEESEEWVKVSIDDIVGYLSKDYVKIDVEFDKAISIEEEQAALAAQAEKERLEREAEEARIAAQKAEQERLARAKAEQEKAAQARKEAQRQAAQSSNSSSTTNTTKTEIADNSTPSTSESSSSSSSSSGTTGQDVVNYALQFTGVPYVYGGTSLTKGADCSGFTQSVYAHFGYGLSRTSGSQASDGKSVSLDSIQPGDLLFYTNSSGSINHVALYIGNGKVVMQSKTGDVSKVVRYNYRTPCKARRIIY